MSNQAYKIKALLEREIEFVSKEYDVNKKKNSEKPSDLILQEMNKQSKYLNYLRTELDIYNNFTVSICKGSKNCFFVYAEADFDIECLVRRKNLKIEQKRENFDGMLKFYDSFPLPINFCSHFEKIELPNN